jgi:hypothetical protein
MRQTQSRGRPATGGIGRRLLVLGTPLAYAVVALIHPRSSPAAAAGCDSSKNKHASRHAHQLAPTHQIVRSMEPDEDWLWCYTDQTLVQAAAGGPAR